MVFLQILVILHANWTAVFVITGFVLEGKTSKLIGEPRLATRIWELLVHSTGTN